MTTSLVLAKVRLVAVHHHKDFPNKSKKRLRGYRYQIPVTYKLAANTMSRLIALDAISIFLNSAEFPMMEAAFLNSLHVSSRRTIVLTMIPSDTSVSSHMSAKGVPCIDVTSDTVIILQPAYTLEKSSHEDEYTFAHS